MRIVIEILTVFLLILVPITIIKIIEEKSNDDI